VSRKTKDAFIFSGKYKLFISAFLLELVSTAVAIFKRNTEQNYIAVETLNSQIRQAQNDFEIAALPRTKVMCDADEALRATGSHRARMAFNNAKHLYEACRCDGNKTIHQKRAAADLEKKKIEHHANTLMSDCESAITLYWRTARENVNWSKRLGVMPPPVYELMELACVHIAPVEIDMTEIVDTAEYLRLIGTPQLPPIPPALLDSNIRNSELPQLMVANNDANTNNEGGTRQ
jgi:hypothetical protein